MTPNPSAARKGSFPRRPMRMPFQLATLAAIFVVAASACSEGDTSTSKESPRPYATPSSVAWTACGPAFQCGPMAVPLDYSNPAHDTIEIAIIRKPATDQRARIGSLLINPGGPGGSGVEYLRRAASSMAHLNERFDLVSFDPRGVGQSAPVRCLSGPQMDSFTSTDARLDDAQKKQATVQAARAYVRACQQRSGRILPFVDTASTARDMDILRAALGDARLTYLGLSYGTFLGQTYARLFPTHVRALALDAVVDPAEIAAADGLVQVKAAFEANLEAFFAYCRAYESCQFGASGDTEARLSALMQRLDSAPVPVGNRLLTKSLAMTALYGMLTDSRGWSILESALTAADQGNGQLLLSIADVYNERHADGSYENFLDANAAIFCLDHPVPSDPASANRIASVLANAPPSWVRGYSVCSSWPLKSKGWVGPLSADGAPPTLLVGGTEDYHTPYAWAESVNKQLAGSVLLTRKGVGHVSYDKSTCARQAEDAYLIDLTLPAPGTVCDTDFP